MTSKAVNKILKWNKEFPINKKRRVCFSSIFIAPRRSGKSFMIKHLLATSLKNKFDHIIVFTTKQGIKDYSEFIPGNLLFEGFNARKMNLIRDINDKRLKPFNILVILDDTCSRKEKYNAAIQELYTNGRHSGVSIIYTTQSPTLVDNNIKMNSDLILIWDVFNTRGRRYISQNLLSGVLHDKNFDKVSEEENFYLNLYKDITKVPHTALVLQLLDSKIYWYKA